MRTTTRATAIAVRGTESMMMSLIRRWVSAVSGCCNALDRSSPVRRQESCLPLAQRSFFELGPPRLVPPHRGYQRRALTLGSGTYPCLVLRLRRPVSSHFPVGRRRYSWSRSIANLWMCCIYGRRSQRTTCWRTLSSTTRTRKWYGPMNLWVHDGIRCSLCSHGRRRRGP